MLQLLSKYSTNACCFPLVLCSVTSSEKVDKAQRYADFTLLSIPYPGTGLMSRGTPKGQVTICFWGLGTTCVCGGMTEACLMFPLFAVERISFKQNGTLNPGGVEVSVWGGKRIS